MRKRDFIPPAVLALVCAVLWLAPSLRPIVSGADEGTFVRARVLETDDSNVMKAGQLDYGTQRLKVEVIDPPAAGRTVRYYPISHTTVTVSVTSRSSGWIFRA